MQVSMEQLEQLQGSDVYDSAGEKIGSVEEIFYDEQTDQPEWIGIGTGFFGTKRVLVPVQGADIGDDGITVPYAKDKVKDSPDIDGDEISQETERELYSYYGLQASERSSDSVLPEGSAGAPRTSEGGESVTRTEEELHVGKRETQAGQARLRKRVETEPVSMDVELQRETARVVREPVDEPVSGRELGEEDVEVTLREEQPVVEKQAVAKERIGLEKDVEVEHETVSDEVRKERVDVEGDVRR